MKLRTIVSAFAFFFMFAAYGIAGDLEMMSPLMPAEKVEAMKK